jgi:hypothetical protein
MSQKPEEKEVTVARFYWKFAAFNFINKRWRECTRLYAVLTKSFAEFISTVEALEYFKSRFLFL